MISVIIPTYNNEKYIEKSVTSAISQSEVSEVIVINDASNDNTLNIILDLKLSKDKIVLVNSPLPQPQGPAYARNLGLDKATGYYISFLDGDDYYLENRFNEMLQSLENDDFYDGVYDNAWAYNALNGKRLTYHDMNSNPKTQHTNLFHSLIFNKDTHIHLSSLLIKKKSLRGIRFNENLKQVEDTDFIYELSQNTYLKHTGLLKSKIYRNIHENNLTSDKKEQTKYRAKFHKLWLGKSIERKIGEEYILHFFKNSIHYDLLEKNKTKNNFYKYYFTLIRLMQYPKSFLSLMKYMHRATD